MPESLEMKIADPGDVKTFSGFIHMNGDALEAFRQEMGFAMSANDIAVYAGIFPQREKRSHRNRAAGDRYLLVGSLQAYHVFDKADRGGI